MTTDTSFSSWQKWAADAIEQYLYGRLLDGPYDIETLAKMVLDDKVQDGVTWRSHEWDGYLFQKIRATPNNPFKVNTSINSLPPTGFIVSVCSREVRSLLTQAFDILGVTEIMLASDKEKEALITAIWRYE